MELLVSGFGRAADFSESCSNKIWGFVKDTKIIENSATVELSGRALLAHIGVTQ
jgi:hypothetical protein